MEGEGELGDYSVRVDGKLSHNQEFVSCPRASDFAKDHVTFTLSPHVQRLLMIAFFLRSQNPRKGQSSLGQVQET
jgi:hypothetical protein